MDTHKLENRKTGFSPTGNVQMNIFETVLRNFLFFGKKFYCRKKNVPKRFFQAKNNYELEKALFE